MPPEPTVFVVDDDEAVRKSLRWLLESVDLSVTTFESATDFLERYQPDQPGCMILDIRMPKMSGLNLQDELSQRGIKIPVIMFTAHADVPAVVRSMKAGAFEFLEKPASDQILLDRVQAAIERDTKQRELSRAQTELESRMDRLTDREGEVMRLIVAGMSNKEVARELAISPKTVEVHRGRVMLKMGASSLAELVRMVPA